MDGEEEEEEEQSRVSADLLFLFCITLKPRLG